jgi:hypothetical protein
VRQRIGTVLDYAHIKGLVPEEVSLRSVTRGLPRQTRQVTHRAAMPDEKAPAFMEALSELRDALRLTILTAVPSNETRKATWDEFGVRSRQGGLVDPCVANEDERGACRPIGAGCGEARAVASPAPSQRRFPSGESRD